jgi:L-lactate dehydrogenase (cytochrome)
MTDSASPLPAPSSAAQDVPVARSAAQRKPLPRRHGDLLSLDDFERAARRHLPFSVFSYIAGCAEDGQSLRANREAFSRYAFVPRVLVDVRRRSTAVDLLGHRWDAPFGIAPMGLAALSGYRSDLEMARAAAQANIPFIVSGASLIRLEDVIAVNRDAWCQVYLTKDESEMDAMLRRVQAAGYRTLVVTLDTPVGANRENNVRAGFTIPARPTLRLAWQGLTHPRWLFGTFLRTILQHGMPHLENTYATTRGVPMFSPSVERDLSERGHLDWRYLRLIRTAWKGKVVVKGVLDARDARQAIEAGVDGVIVSNHGGRQLDGAVAPLQVLPAIVAACPGVPVMLDSGVRRGSDVLKALALGARFVFVGRPFSYAAAIGGRDGVLHAADLLRSEVSRNMALLGVTTLSQVEPGHLVPTPAA